ncbi:hypothetical protein BO83DRAFT_401489 [Aspergillus eucalypticola CBS 122712]|uniref:RNase H type-1 domain-containing protein n=1 Tax=Aspergillus eucalypticola (strain CBS 122712 / IBT 29274) TaxID=1448314 RepID=A0A317UX98_ASPEC|nr:uncharacterized protein BO83DRAFT_401489 [Aspergillus eucalypticola CBS 122712]PWY66664.1 hypothetical protein BO83DRAFT_401489 [Aspergillus eucalypticola CBS 122712]
MSWGHRAPRKIGSRGRTPPSRKGKAQRAKDDARGSQAIDPYLDGVDGVSQRNRDSQTNEDEGSTASVFERYKRRSASSSTSISDNSRTITNEDSQSHADPHQVEQAGGGGGGRKQHSGSQKKKQKQQQQQQPPNTIRIKDDRFDRVLLIKPRQEALNYAKEVTETSPDDNHVFWVDGSTAANEAAPSGVAVIHGHSGQDADELYCLEEIRLSQLAELFAIGAGLRAAVRQLERLQVSGHVVQVFTDCQAAMEMLRPRTKKLSPLAGRLVRRVDALSHRLCSMGVKVELHWVPGHQCVRGHKRADLLSRTITSFMMNNLADKINQINAVRVDCTFLELS